MKEKIYPFTEEHQAGRQRFEGMSQGERQEEIDSLHEKALFENVPSFYERVQSDENSEKKRANEGGD